MILDRSVQDLSGSQNNDSELILLSAFIVTSLGVDREVLIMKC